MARDGDVWCSVIVKRIQSGQIWWSAAMATSPAKRKTACAEIQGSSMQASTPSGKKRGSEALIESHIKELHGHQGSEWRLRPGPPTLGTNGALTCPLSPLVTFAHLCGHPEGFRMVAHTVTVAARSLLCRCCARRMAI